MAQLLPELKCFRRVLSVRETAWEKTTVFWKFMFFLTPLTEDAVPAAGCFTSLQAGRFHFEREQNTPSEFLIEECSLFKNSTYGKSISSGKSLAMIPVKTFHESLLAPED